MVRPDQQRHRLRGDAAARRRHAHHLRRRDRRQALRAGAGRAQRGAGRGRPAEEPVHQPRLLRAENAAHQHHRLQRAAVASRASATLNDKQREYSATSPPRRSTLLAIIDDILDLATIDAGALELKLAPVEVRGGHRRGRPRRARAAPRAHASHLDIRVAEDASEFIADEARVRQVLYNLLVQRHRLLQARRHHTASAAWREAGMMAFAVEDQGVGIPKEQQGARVRAVREPQPGLQATAAPASGSRSSRAWWSCTAAPCRWNPSPARARASPCASPSAAS